MTRDRADHDPGWTARLSHAGVRMDLFESMSDDHDWNLLEASVLEAARESTPSDDDLYPLLARLWTRTLPPADWPPRAPSVARRCAVALVSRRACEIDRQWGFPTDESVRTVREAVIDELALSAADLLAVLAEHWPQVASLEMPIDEGSSLLAFAEEVLLKPLVGAGLQLWLVLRTPLPVLRERTDPGGRDGWDEWSILSGDDWGDLADAELIRLGHRRRELPEVGDESAWLLADARAADHAARCDRAGRGEHRPHLRVPRRSHAHHLTRAPRCRPRARARG
jgi:hypothetical protein